MTYAITAKHAHDYKPINQERAKKLDSMLYEIKKKLPNSEYVIGGGNSISLLLRVYQNLLSKSMTQEEAQKNIIDWIPSEATQLINGSYRDSNFVPHILCMEDNLESLVSEASISKMKLMRRPKEITIWPGKKVESYETITIQEIKERSKNGLKDKLSSNALRLVDMTNPEISYFDLFVHHYISPNNKKVNLTENMTFKVESSGEIVKPEEIRVVSNKDQGEVPKLDIILSLQNFQSIPYFMDGFKFNIANPQYLFKVKEKHHIKRTKDTRDPVDLEVLHNILKFLSEDPVSRMRRGL